MNSLHVAVCEGDWFYATVNCSGSFGRRIVTVVIVRVAAQALGASVILARWEDRNVEKTVIGAVARIQCRHRQA